MERWFIKWTGLGPLWDRNTFESYNAAVKHLGNKSGEIWCATFELRGKPKFEKVYTNG